MQSYPFTAVVGADDLCLALLLSAVEPAVGGVVVRGEKGTAKSTVVRGLVQLLPHVDVVGGCRFACDPDDPASDCPDGPHDAIAAERRPTRLVELPVGATEDRVSGSLDVGRALGEGHATFQPGLLADAHRGLLYVDEVNLLHDHLVDLLLDAAAMGRNTVERDGVSVDHASRFVLVGTMNPEEGELRPQLLDRFGLSVDVAASREPSLRAEVVRRRLAYDADPDGFAAAWHQSQDDVRRRIEDARALLPDVELSDRALATIARVCAGFEVDGMRADIVIARAARAHAAWAGRTDVEREDIRAAARFALAHRRRRGPFDPPGLDEELLDRLLDAEPDPDPEPPSPGDDADAPDDPDANGTDDGSSQQGEAPEHTDGSGPQDPSPQQCAPQDSAEPDALDAERPEPPEPSDSDEPSEQRPGGQAPTGTAGLSDTFRAKTFRVRGTGRGASGRRSAALTDSGRAVGVRTGPGRLHLPGTVTAAAPYQVARGRTEGRLRLERGDLRSAVLRGQESNLVLFCVDASGSMAARRRMTEVKRAVLSLLVDAYERRDRVGVVTFRDTGATVALPPTSSVERAARALAELPHGGRTPLAEGLATAATVLATERLRDPHRRALLVLVTDGRATAGTDALVRAQRIGDRWSTTSTDAVVVDCESGRFRMGLARDLAARMGAQYTALADLGADVLVDAVHTARATARDARSAREVA